MHSSLSLGSLPLARDEGPLYVRKVKLVSSEEKEAVKNGSGRPMGWAATIKRSDVSGVRKLLARGLSVNEKDRNGSTPLMHAVWHCKGWDLRVLRLLVDAGADVNVCNIRLNTPLHFAYERNNLDAVEFLLANGARPSELRRNALGLLPRQLLPCHNPIRHYILSTLGDIELPPAGAALDVPEASTAQRFRKYLNRTALNAMDGFSLADIFDATDINGTGKLSASTQLPVALRTMGLPWTTAMHSVLASDGVRALRGHVAKIRGATRSTRRSLRPSGDEGVLDGDFASPGSHAHAHAPAHARPRASIVRTTSSPGAFDSPSPADPSPPPEVFVDFALFSRIVKVLAPLAPRLEASPSRPGSARSPSPVVHASASPSPPMAWGLGAGPGSASGSASGSGSGSGAAGAAEGRRRRHSPPFSSLPSTRPSTSPALSSYSNHRPSPLHLEDHLPAPHPSFRKAPSTGLSPPRVGPTLLRAHIRRHSGVALDVEDDAVDDLASSLNSTSGRPVIHLDRMPEHAVFLGGACNPTTWRKDTAMPMLSKAGVTFYNPQVDEWSPDLIAVEAKAKKEACLLLFVLTAETRGVASLAEVTELITAGRNIVLVLQDVDKDTKINGRTLAPDEAKDLNRGRAYAADCAERHNVPVYQSIEAAVEECIRRLGRSSK